MNYTIAIFPKIEDKKESDKINIIRKKHDPSYKFIKPHVALVYYFKEKPEKEKLRKISKKFNSFNITLNKINLSPKGNFIFLDVTKGKKEIIKLKEELYKKLNLKWDKNFQYKPHITLANFKTKKEQQKVFKEISKKKIKISCKIDSFTLLEVSKDFKNIKSKKEFNLKK